MPRKQKPPSCEDCFFHKNLLCALELSEPCTTFRPDRPEGLVPPRQPVLLMRPPRWATSQARTAGLAARPSPSFERQSPAFERELATLAS